MQKVETISVCPINGSLSEVQNYIELLKKENAIMRKLITNKGFFNYFFLKLKNHETVVDAFNDVNKQYHSLFGQYRFTDYQCFTQMLALDGN